MREGWKRRQWERRKREVAQVVVGRKKEKNSGVDGGREGKGRRGRRAGESMVRGGVRNFYSILSFHLSTIIYFSSFVLIVKYWSFIILIFQAFKEKIHL